MSNPAVQGLIQNFFLGGKVVPMYLSFGGGGGGGGGTKF